MEFTDIQKEIKTIKDDILKEKLEKNEKEVDDSEEEEQKKDNEDKYINVTSVFLFKKIYNLACDIEKN